MSPGLADDLFEHDGQITKREIRAVTLSALAPRRGELLWDIGAGSGSVSIEWMLADPSMRAVAIEADPERAARIRRNASACGVPGLAIVEGPAPAALDGLPAPDAIFIGGGGTDKGVMEAAINALALRRTAGGERRDAGDRGAAACRTGKTRRRPDPHRRFARRAGGHHAGLAAGHAGDAMVVGEAMIAAGIGCKAGASPAEVTAALEAALKAHALELAAVSVLATVRQKQFENGIIIAGGTLNLPVILVDAEGIDDVSGRVLSHSAKSLEVAGTPSVSEAAALAAAGQGSRLLGPRIAVGPVTCALAIGGEGA